MVSVNMKIGNINVVFVAIFFLTSLVTYITKQRKIRFENQRLVVIRRLKTE